MKRSIIRSIMRTPTYINIEHMLEREERLEDEERKETGDLCSPSQGSFSKVCFRYEESLIF